MLKTKGEKKAPSLNVRAETVTTYAVRITCLIATLKTSTWTSDTCTTLPATQDPSKILDSFSWITINYIVSLTPKMHLKMNLPDRKSVLTDPEGQVKMEMKIPRSSGVNSQPHAHT
ncbi:hypothetical protein Tco_1124523 [Tanacetum coccineum]|uniref:Uncharacterized protein n=1 Tax=Tanacetum coccineum TaxID=301880 RepID=A0ABQ5J6F4_9ASTR